MGPCGAGGCVCWAEAWAAAARIKKPAKPATPRRINGDAIEKPFRWSTSGWDPPARWVIQHLWAAGHKDAKLGCQSRIAAGNRPGMRRQIGCGTKTTVFGKFFAEFPAPWPRKRAFSAANHAIS